MFLSLSTYKWFAQTVEVDNGQELKKKEAMKLTNKVSSYVNRNADWKKENGGIWFWLSVLINMIKWYITSLLK